MDSSTLEAFKVYASGLPTITDQEMSTSDIYKSPDGAPYWRTDPEVLDLCYHFLGVTNRDNFIDIGCGQGLALVQISYWNDFRWCIGVEINAARASLAEKIVTEFKAEMQSQNRDVSYARILNADIIESTNLLNECDVVLAAVDYDAKIQKFLEDFMAIAPPGKRVISNLTLVTPKLSGEQFKRFQVLTVNAKQSLHAGTSFLGSTIRPMTIYTIKNWTDPKDDVSDNFEVEDLRERRLAALRINDHRLAETLTPQNWTTGCKGYTPLQVGKDWVTYEMVVRERSGIYTADSSQAVTPRTNFGIPITLHIDLLPDADSELVFSLWTYPHHLFVLKEYCDREVDDRNKFRQVSPSADLDLDTIFNTFGNAAELPKEDTSFGNKTLSFFDILNDYLPTDMVVALRLKPDQAEVIGKESYDKHGMRFNVIGNTKAFDTLDSGNYDYKIPTMVRRRTITRLGFNLNVKKFVGMNMQNFGIDPERNLIATETTLPDFLPQTVTTTLYDMQNHFELETEARGNALALSYVPLSLALEGYDYKIPKFLVDSDLSQYIKCEMPHFENLNKYVSICSELSVQRLHCHRDGAVNFLMPTEGAMLVFMLLNARPDDYRDLPDCSFPRSPKDFIPRSMLGRVVCVILRAGEMLLFAGSIPHGYITLQDTVAFGGKLITTATIPRLIKYGDEHKKKKCIGRGYNFGHIKKILFHAGGKIFHTMWYEKLDGTEDKLAFFRRVFGTYSNLLSSSFKELGINNAKWMHMKALFNLIDIANVPDIMQHCSGVFYKASSSATIESSLKDIFSDKVYNATPFNELGGDANRIVFPATELDLDFATPEECEDLKEKARYYSTAEFYETHLGENPVAILASHGGRLGIYSLSELEMDEPVSEFSGALRTRAGFRSTYGSEEPLGRCYLLKIKRTKNEIPQNVFVDANSFGGYSLFFRIAGTPNCKIVQACVEERMILIVLATRGIAKGEELTIPHPVIPGSVPKLRFADVNDYLKDVLTKRVAAAVAASQAIEAPPPFDPNMGGLDGASGIETINPNETLPIDPNSEANETLANQDAKGKGDKVKAPTKDKKTRSKNKPTKDPLQQETDKTSPPIRKTRSATRKTITGLTVPPSAAASSVTTKPTVKGTKKAKQVPKIKFAFKTVSDQPPSKDTKKNKRDKANASSQESNSEGEDETTKSSNRLMESYQRRKRRGVVDNDQTAETLDNLPLAERVAVEAERVPLFYETYEEYRRTNLRLLRMYRRTDVPLACAVCPHWGKSIERKMDKPFSEFGAEEFREMHWHSFHKNAFKCDYCSFKNDSLKGVRMHERVHKRKNSGGKTGSRKRKAESSSEENEEEENEDEGEDDDEPQPSTSRGRPRKPMNPKKKQGKE